MNSDQPLNIPLRERLEKLNKSKEIARSFREINLSIPLEDSRALKEVEDTVLECTNYSWQIDSMLEDDKISPYEYEQISTHLEKINDLTHKLAEHHKENAKLMNKIIGIYNTLQVLIQEISYLSVSNDFDLSDEKEIAKEIGYLIEESVCCEVLERLSNYFVTRDDLYKNPEISKLEREIINSIKVVGNIENGVLLNVLYIKPSIVMDEILSSIEILRILVNPIHRIIKERYYREELKTAKIGLELVSEDKSLSIGETIKIKGLFSKKKGFSDFEELSEILNY